MCSFYSRQTPEINVKQERSPDVILYSSVSLTHNGQRDAFFFTLLLLFMWSRKGDRNLKQNSTLTYMLLAMSGMHAIILNTCDNAVPRKTHTVSQRVSSMHKGRAPLPLRLYSKSPALLFPLSPRSRTKYINHCTA